MRRPPISALFPSPALSRSENKTAEAMAAISPNLICPEPGIQTVADALERAGAGADDLDRRVGGSAVRWARSWGESFGDELDRKSTRLNSSHANISYAAFCL